MQMHLTDQQIIERVRWNQRHRRTLGAVCALVGVAGVLLILYFVSNLYQKSQATLNLIAQSPSPSSQQVATSLDETRYVTGFTLGFTFAGGLTSMSVLATTGCVLLLTISRKDTLLLKCWDGHAAAQ